MTSRVFLPPNSWLEPALPPSPSLSELGYSVSIASAAAAAGSADLGLWALRHRLVVSAKLNGLRDRPFAMYLASTAAHNRTGSKESSIMLFDKNWTSLGPFPPYGKSSSGQGRFSHFVAPQKS